ncbi:MULTISPECIES: 5-oxoprolinase subunit PxpA [Gracilibacillus]|uniref:5-oxoprolinase subunit PxpA n=1 Tax=Gracilibacillus TaxID=74385 RepID=UPI0008269FA7|nr:MULTISPECIES: 5-oxoprolinase subunit PxpA [Gracilibacillus]
MRRISLNCDLGESFGVYQTGNDQAIIPLVDEINVACGFHAGDAHTMNQTIRLAKQHHVEVGAHPGLPDIQGFGRRRMQVTAQEVYDWTVYQIGALKAFTEIQHVKLHHIKPHGALYNMACQDQQLALAIAQAVFDLDPSLRLVGLSGSELIHAGSTVGLAVVNEVFADRRYHNNGRLVARGTPGSLLHDTESVIQQVRQMLDNGTVMTQEGNEIPIIADTICVHGDNTAALELVKQIRTILTSR